MNKIELIQNIGNEVCEGCGPDRDCEMEIDDCDRIGNAIESLETFLADSTNLLDAFLKD